MRTDKLWIARCTTGGDAFVITRTPFKRNVKRNVYGAIYEANKIDTHFTNVLWTVAPIPDSYREAYLAKYELDTLYDTKESDGKPE